MRFFRSKGKGFTLMEVIVSIAIMGILASVVYVSLGESRKKARDTQRVSDLQQVELALRLYKDVHGLYPGLQRANGNIEPILGLYENGVALSSLVEVAEYFGGSVPRDPDGGEYYYNPFHECIDGISRSILVVESMETKLTAADSLNTPDDDDANGNWNRVCLIGTVASGLTPDQDSYVVLLK